MVEKRALCNSLAPIEHRAEGEKRIISGYGSLFYDGTEATEYQYYDIRERVMSGAFDRAIKEDDTRSFFNHDANMILGRTLAGTTRLSTDSKGLRYEIDIPNTTAGNDTWESVNRGDVSGASIMFRAVSMWEEDGDTWIRNVTAIEPLYEVGPVVFPAFVNTTASTRSGAIEDVVMRELEEVKRRRRNDSQIRQRQYMFMDAQMRRFR